MFEETGIKLDGFAGDPFTYTEANLVASPLKCRVSG